MIYGERLGVVFSCLTMHANLIIYVFVGDSKPKVEISPEVKTDENKK